MHKINQAGWGSSSSAQLCRGLGSLRRSCEMTTDDEAGTYLGQRSYGGLWFRCWHAHCSGRTWQDFRLDINCRGKMLAVNEEGRYS